MKKSILATTVASLMLATSYSYAQSSSDVETMVVTANRFEQSLESTTMPVEFVSKEEIEAIQAKSVLEVLRRLPGVQISSNGGYGQTQSIYVRGAESDHVLFLIDGVRIGSATLGSASLAAIPVVAIERIEYVRGSRGAVYGSDAIAGVINIITKNKRSEAVISAGVGSDNFAQGQVSVSHGLTEDLHASLAVSRSSTDGFSAQSSDGSEDDDGFDSDDIIATVDYAINNNLSVDLQTLYHEGEVEYDPSDAYKDERLYNIATSLNYRDDSLISKLQLSMNQDYSKDYAYSSEYQTDRQAVLFSNQYKVSDSLSMGLGIDWYRDDVSESSAAYDETSRENAAVYITSAYMRDVFQLEGALRSDDNERYGQNTTWQLGAGWNLLPHYRVTANAGTGFKAPTFNDLYSSFGGNSDIKPEESKSYELGLESERGLLSWRIAGYINQIDDLIDWQPTGAYTYSPQNIGEVEIKGIELSASFDTGAFSHNVSFDFMDPRDKENDRQLERRAKQSGKWNITYFAERWQADLSYLYQGKRYDYLYSGETVELDPYSLVDLSLSYFLFDSCILRGRVANLLDEEYTLADGYNTQERSYYASVEYRF